MGLAIPFRNFALTAALVASAVYVIPEALVVGNLLRQRADPEVIVSYRLRQVPLQVYVSKIQEALLSDDADLADSLLSLADGRYIPIPPALRQQVADAQDISILRTLRETWKGINKGDASSPEALAGAVAADMTGIGDARDLVDQAQSFYTTGEYDVLTVGLAITGLVATGVTVFTMGGGSPARVGITALKFASKAGTISARLRHTLLVLAKEVIDGSALRKSFALFRQGEFRTGRQVLLASVRAAPLETMRTMTAELGTIISTRGYRAGRDVLRVAENPRDFSRLRGLATTLGRKFRGVLFVLGAGALSLAGLTLTIAGWLVSALLWMIAALYFAYRVFRRILRLVKGDRSAPAAHI